MPTRRRNAPRHPAVNSPAFKRWFGASKVVDAQGEPLVVYHGTATPTFEAFSFHHGISAPVPNAAYFTDTPAVANDAAGYGPGRAIYPVYLRMVRPLVIDAEGEHAIYLTERVVSALSRGRYDGVILKNVREYFSDTPSTTYAVFEPTQVKSATGNAGTFDPADPRITRNPRRRNPEDTTVLRLTGFRNKYGAAAEAFLRDLFDASYPNPLNPRERILAGIEVAVEVSPLRGGVHIDEVRALRPGKGEGTKAMRFLAELADKHGVTMTLFPMPFGDQKMDTDDLVRFYRKHGFRFESEEGDEEEADIDMIRFPRQTNPRGLDVRRGIPGTYRAQFVGKRGRSRAYPAHAGAPWDKVMVRLASETTLSGGRMYDAVMQAAREGRTTLPGKRGAVSVQRVTNPDKVSR
jgi:hypothetical protein